MSTVNGLTIDPSVKTLTALNAAILLKYHACGFGVAVAFSLAMFAPPVVGVGSVPASSSTPPSPPPGAGGVPGFTEQLERATAQAVASEPAEGIPSAIVSGVNTSSPNRPATVPAGLAVSSVKLAKTPAKADWKDEFATRSADIPVSPDKSAQLPVEARKDQAATAGSIPEVSRKSDRRAFPHDHASGAPAYPRTHGFPSNQNTDLRNVIPAQVPAPGSTPALLQTDGSVSETAVKSLAYVDPSSHSVKDTALTNAAHLPTNSSSVPVVSGGSYRRSLRNDQASDAVASLSTPTQGLSSNPNIDIRNSITVQVPASDSVPERAGQPSSPLPPAGGLAAATLPIRADAAFNPNIEDVAFTARIKPGGGAAQLQIRPASSSASSSTLSANSMATNGESASQSVKATGRAATKDGDPGYEEPEDSALGSSSTAPSAPSVSSSISSVSSPASSAGKSSPKRKR